LIRISVEEGGIEYAKERIMHYRSKAVGSLPSGIQPELKESLLAFLEYAISRDK
jgi:geranylgeranyl pyrophosphate synthase